ncbi:MAG TPA: glycosyltransferase family 39 protein [Anaerolineae bacterium]
MTSESASARRYHFRLSPLWFAIALFFAALLPRLAAIGRYVTPDELVWVYRSALFRQALASGAWLDTLTTGHPGVTTTWLGALAMSVQLALRPGDQAVYEWITRLAWYAPENVAAFSQLATFLTAGRLALALVNSLGVVAMYVLARPLFGQLVAILSALLIALDPFIAGLSGLLHVDALMTTFATLSLLALALMPRQTQAVKPRRLWYAPISGAAAALAILSKSPALLLLPIVALFLCLSLFHNQDVTLADRLRRLLRPGSAWLAAFLATILLAFPALWASPARVVAAVNSNASHEIEALRPTFFLGQVAFEHGPLFYPVTLALRLSPIVFLGLILAFYLIIRHLICRPHQWFSLPTLLLGLWSLFYVVAISFAAKKFDRYILPVIPALTFLAAAAWVRFPYPRQRMARLVAPLLVAVQALHLLWVLPYPLAAYNPLLGGPFMAQRVLPLGWGESISAAGRWLAAQPDTAGKTAVASTTPSLAPFFPGQTLPLVEETLPQADYVILTAGMKQSDPAALARLANGSRLVHTIRYGGLDQAWIHAQALPQKTEFTLPDLPTPLSFGSQMQLLAAGATADSQKLHIYTRWRRQQPDGRYTVKMALQDDQGHNWAELETTLLNEVYFYPEHWAPDETPLVRYTLDLPPAIPPVNYTVTLSLFDSNSGAQLPLLAADGAFLGVIYEVEAVSIPVPALPPPAGNLDIPVTVDAAWLEDSLSLLGYSPLPATVITGGRLDLDLYWQAQSSLPAGLKLALSLGDRPFTFPLSRYDSGRWRPGDVIHEKVSLVAPPDMPAGHYSLQVRLLNAEGKPLPGSPFRLGEVEVIALDRLFSLPDDISVPLTYRFGGGVNLRGLDLLTPLVAPGEAMRLRLYWQTERQPGDIYTAFVHVLGPDDEIVFQADGWPGGLPSHTWAAGQVIIDEHAIDVPPDVVAGEYRIAVGLYTAADGQRLPVGDDEGTAYPDRRAILPVTVTVVAADE